MRVINLLCLPFEGLRIKDGTPIASNRGHPVQKSASHRSQLRRTGAGSNMDGAPKFTVAR